MSLLNYLLKHNGRFKFKVTRINTCLRATLFTKTPTWNDFGIESGSPRL